MTTAVSILKSINLADFPAPANIITVSSKETPVQGFEKLITHKILAAPVYDEATKSYTGFLDIRDLVSYAVYAFENHDKLDTYKKDGITSLVDDVTVTYLSRRNPFQSVKKTDTLLEAAIALSKLGVHRVPVVDPDTGAVVNIVSQSSLINFFQKHNTELAEELSRQVGSIGIGTSPVNTVQTTTLAIDVFRLMDNTKRTALGVVDSNGDMIGNVSGKDLKLFINSKQSYDLLNLPIMTFLQKLRSEAIDISAPTFCVSLNDTLATLIGKLAATHVHRIYVTSTERDFKPVKVVSLTDILRYFLKSGGAI